MWAKKRFENGAFRKRWCYDDHVISLPKSKITVSLSLPVFKFLRLKTDESTSVWKPNETRTPRFFIISSITTVRKLFCVISGAYSDGYLLVSFVTLEFDHMIHVAYSLDCPTVISCNWGRFFFLWTFSRVSTLLLILSSRIYIVLLVMVISLLAGNFVVYFKIYLIVRRHQRQIEHQYQHQQQASIFRVTRLNKTAFNTFLVYILLLCCSVYASQFRYSVGWKFPNS